jgi:photosystem I reaction center subunit XII
MLYYRVRSNKDISSENTFMISDTQIFVALILALVSLALAIRLGTSLYQ